MPRRPYPTDLTDAQWAILEPLVPGVKSGGRPLKHPRREIVDALLYVLRGVDDQLALLAARSAALADGLRLLPDLAG